jgi:hypothetical protein
MLRPGEAEPHPPRVSRRSEAEPRWESPEQNRNSGASEIVAIRTLDGRLAAVPTPGIAAQRESMVDLAVRAAPGRGWVEFDPLG